MESIGNRTFSGSSVERFSPVLRAPMFMFQVTVLSVFDSKMSDYFIYLLLEYDRHFARCRNFSSVVFHQDRKFY